MLNQILRKKKKRRNGIEVITEEIITEMFPELMKYTIPRFRNPNKPKQEN